jgi:hypothetical protein
VVCSLGLTKSVLESALEAETSEHLGYEQYDAAGQDGANSRNGTRSKTAFTEIGAVEDRDAPGHGRHVRAGDREKWQRRLSGVDQIILSLSEKSLTTEQISANFADVYGGTVSKDTISKYWMHAQQTTGRISGWTPDSGVARGVSHRDPQRYPASIALSVVPTPASVGFIDPVGGVFHECLSDCQVVLVGQCGVER